MGDMSIAGGNNTGCVGNVGGNVGGTSGKLSPRGGFSSGREKPVLMKSQSAGGQSTYIPSPLTLEVESDTKNINSNSNSGNTVEYGNVSQMPPPQTLSYHG